MTFGLEMTETEATMDPVTELVGFEKRITLTVSDLTTAIKNGIDMKGMPDEQAQHLAQHVLNF
ncbi:MAG: hypothetical protein AB7E27_02285, partial [Candidatus Methanomethylophilaceae archaeon]